ncbi:hypothetical protein Y032_0191g1331 [Ancylostoma ceylanicum]|uniref:Uncharacterized protein n=1 Tax=Ancylostoma ceylanicum TaxID=53326 RepID=A0A016SQR8_9BILA|nr:hypothetical protein Y032_0191g1331 [Ancylostoma ceylanicum]
MEWGLEHWIGTPLRNYKGIGMFIEEEDCSGMEQKMNCSILAACRGQVIQEVLSSVIFLQNPSQKDRQVACGFLVLRLHHRGGTYSTLSLEVCYLRIPPAIASYSYVPDVKLLQGFPRGARIAPTLLNLNPSSIPGLNERKADSVRQIRCIPCNLRS